MLRGIPDTPHYAIIQERSITIPGIYGHKLILVMVIPNISKFVFLMSHILIEPLG